MPPLCAPGQSEQTCRQAGCAVDCYDSTTAVHLTSRCPPPSKSRLITALSSAPGLTGAIRTPLGVSREFYCQLNWCSGSSNSKYLCPCIYVPIRLRVTCCILLLCPVLPSSLQKSCKPYSDSTSLCCLRSMISTLTPQQHHKGRVSKFRLNEYDLSN